MIDRIWRLIYWIGYRVLRFTWRFRQPTQEGALIALWCDGRVLAVQQSYRTVWTLPGGGVRPGEDAAAAACRELGEEVGIAVEPDRVGLAHDSTFLWEHRYDHVRIFEFRVDPPPPTLRIDRREITAAVFVGPAVLRKKPLPPHLEAYLDGRAVSGGHSTA